MQVLTVYHAVALVDHVLAREPVPAHAGHVLVQLLVETSTVNALIVTIIYWSLLFRGFDHATAEHIVFEYVDVRRVRSRACARCSPHVAAPARACTPSMAR